MKKLLLLFAAILMANTGLKAEIMNGVKYLDANGVEQTVDAIVVTDADEPVIWGTAGKTTWYVCEGAILSKGAICQGDVHLIICQGLSTATGITDDTNKIYTPGIQVSGEGNSLTIYGQTIMTGQHLHATGGKNAAGIGGGEGGSGSNITINGGSVTATGNTGAGIGGGQGGDGTNITINGGIVKATSKYGAAIGGGKYCSGSNITINDGEVMATGELGGAGIGGGQGGSGSNITINGCRTVTATSIHGAGIGGGVDSFGSDITIKGGTVTANSDRGSGIGGGEGGSGSNITMPVNYRIKVNEVLIHNDGTDLADLLAGKNYVTAYPDKYLNERNTAIATINAAIEGITNENILAIAATGITGVFNAEEVADINGIKEKTLADLQNVITFYNAGKADGYERGKADALGSLGTKQNGPAVILTDKDGKEFIFYSPKSVEYIKVKE